MKSNNIYIGIITAGLLATVTIISCDKNLDKTDPNAVAVDNYFKTSDRVIDCNQCYLFFIT